MSSKESIIKLVELYNDGYIVDFPTHILKGEDLAGIDFSDIWFIDATFDYSDLSYCDFSGAAFRGSCSFDNAVFHDTIFTDSSGLPPSVIETHRSDIFLTDEDYEKSHRKGDAS